MSKLKDFVSSIFGTKTFQINSYFTGLSGYTPVFTTFNGGVYEMELTRSCIHTFASHCSKLEPVVEGADLKNVAKILRTKPNIFMTGAQFLYKVATIYETTNTCFIAPIHDNFERLVGFYPLNPEQVEIVEVEGSDEPWVRYTFANGVRSAIELSRVAVVSKFLYKSDIVGEDNRALLPTLKLMHSENEGIDAYIKTSARPKFYAQAGNLLKGEALKKEANEFSENNLGSENNGGVLLFPSTWKDVKQASNTTSGVDAAQMKLIENRAHVYFGTNEKILKNMAYGDEWDAYYEGKIEPFALQLSQAMTSMIYSALELSRENRIVFSADRMQYMTNSQKLNVATQMFDRGIYTLNQIMDIFNQPHVEDGDKRYIRKEYAELSQLGRPEGSTDENLGKD